MLPHSNPYNIKSIALNSKLINLDFEDNVAVIHLNRPNKYNAINQELIDGFLEVFKILSKQPNIGALVITGRGKGFCAGADIDNFGLLTPEQGAQYIIEAYLPIINSLVSLDMPTIAAVNGTAAGFGASLALACDFRVMSSSSALLFAFINMALGPDGGASWLLSRLTGHSKALEIMLEGEKIGGNLCKDLGLTNKITSDKSLVLTAKTWAHRLSQKPRTATKITKSDLLFADNHTLKESIMYEAEKQIEAFKSPDLIRAVESFNAKK